MTNKELQKLAEEYAQNQVDVFGSKRTGEDANEAIKRRIKRHFMAGAESVLNGLGIETRDLMNLNVRLNIVSNGAIFTDLNCDDKYLGTEVFFNESDEDVAIYEELGGWLYTELENKGLAGKNIELSIKVKEV